MPRILVVEDDTDIAELIAHYLTGAGHTVERLTSGRDVLPRLRREPVDLVILDIMLPGLDGLRVCGAMRSDPATAGIPVIMLTARGAALLRRISRPVATLVKYGPITIDADKHQVMFDGIEVKLTAKEFLLLQYLVQHRGRVLSRDLLLSDVWGYQYTGGTRTVDVHVRRLREKLPVLADAIETIKQFGYKLADRP